MGQIRSLLILILPKTVVGTFQLFNAYFDEVQFASTVFPLPFNSEFLVLLKVFQSPPQFLRATTLIIFIYIFALFNILFLVQSPIGYPQELDVFLTGYNLIS